MNNSSQKDINDQTPATARNEKSQPQKGSYLERLNNRNSPEEVENLAKQKNLPLIIKGIDGSGKKTGRL